MQVATWFARKVTRPDTPALDSLPGKPWVCRGRDRSPAADVSSSARLLSRERERASRWEAEAVVRLLLFRISQRTRDGCFHSPAGLGSARPLRSQSPRRRRQQPMSNADPLPGVASTRLAGVRVVALDDEGQRWPVLSDLRNGEVLACGSRRVRVCRRVHGVWPGLKGDVCLRDRPVGTRSSRGLSC
jgi:hypothetical protein